MYSSLRTIDIVTTAADGRRLLIQTDHRTAAEVERDADLSVLFALTRILMSRSSEEGQGARVRYAALEEHHPRLAEVAASTGAELEVAGRIADVSEVVRRAPAELADQAFARLARDVLERDGFTLDEAGLANLEATCAGAPTEAEDELAYWTTVVELAAATGEVMRATVGGRWIDAPGSSGADIPFVFRSDGEGGLRDCVGQAVKFLRHGAAESPRVLLRLGGGGTPDQEPPPALSRSPDAPMAGSPKRRGWLARLFG